MVVYGRSGTGKTTFASTLPKPTLYIDVKDAGTDSISDVKDIDVFEVESFADFEDAYWWLKKQNKKYKSVVVDTCTQLQTLVVQEVADKKKKKSGKPGEWGSMTRQDWGNVASLLKEWLLNYRDLTDDGLQVLFIAQDRVFNMDEEASDEESLLPEVGPALSPSVARTLNAAVSVVGNTFIRERVVSKKVDGKTLKKTVVEYCLGLAPSAIYTRKLRKPLSTHVPEAIVDPEFVDVVDIIKGE